MQKQLEFVITSAALLSAIASLALYTDHIANAQNNMTSAGGAKNTTAGSNMTAGNTTGSNMTGAGNTTGGSSIHTAKPAGMFPVGPGIIVDPHRLPQPFPSHPIN